MKPWPVKSCRNRWHSTRPGQRFTQPGQPGYQAIRPHISLTEAGRVGAQIDQPRGDLVLTLRRKTRRRRRLLGSLTWASIATAAPNAFGAAMAFPGRQAIALCGDGGFTMLGLGDLLSQVQRQARVVNVIFNNSMLDFDNIEQQEADPLRPVRD